MAYYVVLACPACDDGEFRCAVWRETEGSELVIGGIHSWTTAEVEEQSCSCQLSPSDLRRVEEQAVGRIDDYVPVPLWY